MEVFALILLAAGILIQGVANIWLLVVAFQESLMWGLGCLLIPFVALIFVVMNWEVAKKRFLLGLGGAVPLILALILAPPVAG